MTEDLAPYGRQRVVGVIQARTGSSRLPNKVLLPIGGRAMILRIYDRLRLCRELDEVVAAIPDTPDNDRLALILEHAGVRYVRGPEEQLATRLLMATAWQFTGADAIVRITADCPLIDPGAVDEMVVHWRQHPQDYASNVHPTRTWPDGLDCEVFRTLLLARLEGNAEAEPSPSEWVWEREHLVNALPSLVRLPSLAHLHWTVDTAEDLAGARVVYARLPEGFTMAEVLAEFGEVSLQEIGKRHG